MRDRSCYLTIRGFETQQMAVLDQISPSIAFTGAESRSLFPGVHGSWQSAKSDTQSDATGVLDRTHCRSRFQYSWTFGQHAGGREASTYLTRLKRVAAGKTSPYKEGITTIRNQKRSSRYATGPLPASGAAISPIISAVTAAWVRPRC